MSQLLTKNRSSSSGNHPVSPSIGYSSASPSSATSSANVFRNLVFGGSLSLCVTVAGNELPAMADRTIESCYIQAPRISYLPLLLPLIRKHLLELVLDESSAAVLSDDDIWFDYNGVPLKWNWPIGLLYDCHTSHASLTTSTTPTSPKPPPSLANYFSPNSSTSHLSPNTNANASSPVSVVGPSPFRITVHLKSPPQDTLLLGPSVEGCRSCFMHQIKEADFVRWGSTKRVTNLRKEQQDNLWEGVIHNDFDRFWTVASKLVPLPTVPSTSPDGTRTFPTTASSFNEVLRSIPMRIYLPDGAPVIQNVVPPYIEGVPTTLRSHLSSILPLFFPVDQRALAYPLIHGVVLPLDTELHWLGASMCGADGWLGIVLVLGR